MVGHRRLCALAALALLGCGSSSSGAGGNAGSAQAGVAGDARPDESAGGGATNSAGTGAISGAKASGGSGGVKASGGSGGVKASGGSGGVKASGGASGSGGWPACIAQDDANAPFLSFKRTADPAPAAMGGTVVSGEYFLTDLTYHGGTQGSPDCSLLVQTREVLRINAISSTEGTILDMEAHKYPDQTDVDFSSTTGFTYVAAGTSLSTDYTCSVSGQYMQPYTATANQFFFIRGPFDAPCDTGVTLVLTYDKQP